MIKNAFAERRIYASQKIIVWTKTSHFRWTKQEPHLEPNLL